VICDDQPEMRAAIRQALERRPQYLVVTEAVDADTAVEAVRAHRPDILILDVTMPGGGPQVACTVRAVHPTIRILVYSAAADSAIRQVMFDAGADDYLVKTGRVGPLLTALDQASAAERRRPRPGPGRAGLDGQHA
jgi:DNA-binding NarL/FixJ family response regulator